ncbi:cdtl-7 [Symbiodinium sp. KB8]|nr:cdtl-7 [Symbiodinium sp. KB8]
MVRAYLPEEDFKAMPYWQQWDEVVKMIFEVGGLPALPATMMHLVWNLLQMGLWYATARAFPSPDGFYFGFLRNALMGHFLFEFLSWTGTYSGPLMGNINPPFPWTRMRFIRGTIKEPFFQFLGYKRTWLDVLVCSSVVPIMIFLLVTPDAGAWEVMTWIGSGVAKHGDWFVVNFAAEWVLPYIFAGSRFWQNLIYKDIAGGDCTPTRLAVILGYMAAILEWAGPLFLLFAPFCGSYQTSLAFIGLGLMVLMHIYIIVHLPFIDVFAINLIPILWSIYCFWMASVGFDYADLWQMPMPLKLCFVGFALQTVYGQIYTDQVCYQNCFRFWSGNFSFSWFLMTDSAIEKMKMSRVISTADFPLSEALKASGLMAEWECDFFAYFALGLLWSIMPSQRLLPLMVHEVRCRKTEMRQRWFLRS